MIDSRANHLGPGDSTWPEFALGDQPLAIWNRIGVRTVPPLGGAPSLAGGRILNSFDSLRAAAPNSWSGGSSDATVQLVSLPLDSTPQLISALPLTSRRWARSG